MNELTATPTPTRLKIQIRKLKNYTPSGSMDTKKADIPLETGKEFHSVAEVLTTAWEELYKKADLPDTKDLFFTLGLTENDMDITRTWLDQKVVLFDCDKAEESKAGEYQRIFAEITHIPASHFSLMWTGGGFHFIISKTDHFESKEFFQKYKIAYQILLAKLTSACNKAGLPCLWDPNVFAPNFMSRLPGSTNSKYPEGSNKVKLLQASLIDCDFDLAKVAGIPELHKHEHIHKKELAYYKIDKDTVLAGCQFLKYSKENAKNLTEPEWFATLSILTKLPAGDALSHEYSKPHHSYSEDATNSKILAIKNSGFGPRTCASIESMFPGCQQCKYKGLVKSPVQIKGDKFIATRESGFATMSVNKDGQPGAIKFQHHDLMLNFEEENPFVFIPERKKIFTWNGTQWNPKSDSEMKQYAQDNYKPANKVNNRDIAEFWGLLSRVNVRDFSSFFDTPELRGKINLRNGVFDLETNELLPHSPHLGFQDTRNFDYSPTAEASLFLKMIEEITKGDKQIQNILQEWFGYTISGCDPFAQKMLICTGEGQNGKSKLLEILASLIGQERFFTTSFGSLQKENTIANFENKDMLMFDEVPTRSEKSTWEFLKALSSGSAVTGAHKYEKAFTFKMRAKIAMTCNNLPGGTDPTHGYFRRLLIIPFNATFSKETGNLDATIAERIIETELPGVLNWAIAGYKRLKLNSWQFSPSKIIDEALSEYKLSVDSLTRFFKDYLEIGEQMAGDAQFACELDGKWYLDTDKLYETYATEAKENGGYASGKQGFLTRLKVYIKSLIGGTWVKVDTGDRDFMLRREAGNEVDNHLVILTRRMVGHKRKLLLHGVKLCDDLEIPPN